MDSGFSNKVNNILEIHLIVLLLPALDTENQPLRDLRGLLCGFSLCIRSLDQLVPGRNLGPTSSRVR
jgi:hypothetical protein